MKKILLLTAYCFLMSSCASKMFKQSLESNTINDYDAFIKKYPTHKNVMIAKEKREDLVWEVTIKSNDVAGYENYLEEYPSGKNIVIAKDNLENLKWEDAKRFNTKVLYEKYMASYPNGKFTIDAKNAIEEIVWKSALDSYYKESFVHYLKLYPNGFYSSSARNKINEIDTWAALNKKRDYLEISNFIKTNPKSHFITDAHKILDKIKKDDDKNFTAYVKNGDVKNVIRAKENVSKLKRGLGLFLAAKHGHYEVVNVLVNSDVKIDITVDGLTPLMVGARQGYPKIVELLLKNGADKTITGSYYKRFETTKDGGMIRIQPKKVTFNAESLARKNGFKNIANMIKRSR